VKFGVKDDSSTPNFTPHPIGATCRPWWSEKVKIAPRLTELIMPSFWLRALLPVTTEEAFTRTLRAVALC